MGGRNAISTRWRIYLFCQWSIYCSMYRRLRFEVIVKNENFGIFGKNLNLLQRLKFSSKIEIFIINWNFRQKVKFSPKSEIFVKKWNSRQKLTFSSKVEIFAKIWNFRQELKFSSKMGKYLHEHILANCRTSAKALHYNLFCDLCDASLWYHSKVARTNVHQRKRKFFDTVSIYWLVF